jgi:hypothetical protein
MSFHNLTPTWTTQPLTDPARAADVVDLMVSLGERHRGTFTVLLCDPDDRYRGTVTIDLPSQFANLTPTLGTADACSTALHPVIPAVHTVPGAALILALGRPGPASWPELDNEWAEAATHICRAADVRLLGFYIASAARVYQPLRQAPVAA